MRSSFIKKLIRSAEVFDNIFLLTGDLGYGVFEEFSGRFPDRFINVGVAEQNMASIAAGLASEGAHVFTYSISNFATFRCAEQLRNDIDYHDLAVTTVANGGGVSYGNLGYSHHGIQDFGLIRLLPNSLIASPVDAVETELAMDFLIKNPQPSYLRLGRSIENLAAPESSIGPGEIVYRVGDRLSKRLILGTGSVGPLLIEMCRKGRLHDDVAVGTLPLWGMGHKRKFLASLPAHLERLVVVEDHIGDGGLGSWCLEAMHSSGTPSGAQVRLVNLGTRVFQSVGRCEYLWNSAELTENAVWQSLY